MFIATNRSLGADGWFSEVIKSLKAQSPFHAALDSPHRQYGADVR